MMLKYRKKLILAKVETTTGTAVSLAAADAVLARDIELTALAGETVSRDLVRPYLGNSEELHVNSHQSLSFKVEIAGSGSAATAPAWGKLLQACALKETVTANTSVSYAPEPDVTKEKTLTLSLNIDGQLHKLHGCRGTFSLEFTANQIPTIAFVFTGRWNDPASNAAVANPSFTAWEMPILPTHANTPTFSLMGKTDLSLSTFSYEHGNEVAHREMIGTSPEVIITDRKPSGSLTVDAPKVSAVNLIAKAKEKGTGVLQIVHGAAAGAIIQIDAPKVSLSDPSYSEDNGILQMQLKLSMLPVSGNDEIKITTK